MNFSDNLKRIRKEQNLSQEQIAEKLGVSRQSVSKWENGEAYPEMDKMIQLCQMFNLNIDELLNQDIKEVNSNKQAKNNVNKFIEDFLDYITKTIDMFSSMKFKQKLKCIFEQIIIMIILATVLFLIGIIGGFAFSYLFSFLPYNIYYPFLHIVGSLYILCALVLGSVLLFHIFKVRYLDYYVIVKSSSKKETIEDEENHIINETSEESKKIILEKKVEKLVIRDPEHSGYRFISWLVNCLLFCVKAVAVFVGLCGCLSLVLLITCLIIALVFIKTGLLFLGAFLGLVAIITTNFIALNIIYNFIVSKKVKKTKLAMTFVVALILGGVGIGLSMIGVTNFSIIEDLDSKYYQETIINLDMHEDLYFEGFNEKIEYVESDNDDVKVVIKHSPFYHVGMSNAKHEVFRAYYFEHYLTDEKIMDLIKNQIYNINDKKIVDYSNLKIYIYANSENIKILKDNINEYYEYVEEQEIVNYYESQITECESKYATAVQDYETKLDEYEVSISKLETRICELEGNCY